MLIKLKTTFLLCIITLFLVACGTPVEGLYQSPSLNYMSVTRNHIGIGGVTSSVRPLPTSVRNTYASSLRNSIITKYPGLDVMPAGQSSIALGASHYEKMMTTYRNSGIISNADLTTLANHIHNMRFLVFARIVENHVGHDRRSAGDSIDYTTDRTLRVEYKVYDLQNKRMVWSGTIRKWDENMNDYSVLGYSDDYFYDDHHHHKHHGHHEERRKDRALVRDAMNIAATAMVESNHSYPSAPSPYKLFANASNGFASHLPKPAKS